MKLLLNIVLFIILTSFSVFAQLPQEDLSCMDQVKSALKKYQRLPDTLDTYFMDYDLTIISKKNINKIQNSNVKITYNNDKMVIMSPQMDFFQDGVTSYMVLMNEKTIYVNDSKKYSDPMKRLNYFKELQDIVFINSKLVSCNSVNQNGNSEKVIIINVNTIERSPLSNTQLEFHLLPTDQISEMIISYLNRTDLEKVTMRINKVDLKFKWDMSNSGLTEFLFDKNMILKDKYKDFKIIDNRSKAE